MPPMSTAPRNPPRALGGVDVLVCSAGIAGANAPTWEYPLEEWRRVFDVNVHGVFHS